MLIKTNHIAVVLLFITSICSCKVPYAPTPITTSANYLVVEGLINISDSTYINLSRTVTVMAKSVTKPELRAVVTIESNTGNSYPVTELGKGLYGAPNYNLSPGNQYRLRIKTLSGSTYISDFGETEVAPPIDSVNWVAKDDGVHISLDTHNLPNNSRYYRWDYTETWEIYTVPILPQILPVHCWGTQISSEVLLASNTTLADNIIQNQPITFIPIPSEKLSYRYSILIKQYVLSKDANEYWSLLKKNTEQLGSIFDNQPSASIGNLHNINNAAEPVIGFITAGTVTSTRIFIDRFTQLSYLYFLTYYDNQVDYCDLGIRAGGGYLLPDCADCTGKPRTPPAFW